ncbi:hypothetical protein BJ875DRAFT_436305 [Amylocarpus encephaloides]|uniref:Uncharacterized protein n=1 Tax=Amylocarpus encephaloides TaxID=45428 RepID=A0A9P8CAI9_9HELO|nr:hypothetical protein BJ875DRAFT_436305 [Amylocarpus encephaloides]
MDNNQKLLLGEMPQNRRNSIPSSQMHTHLPIWTFTTDMILLEMQKLYESARDWDKAAVDLTQIMRAIRRYGGGVDSNIPTYTAQDLQARYELIHEGIAALKHAEILARLDADVLFNYEEWALVNDVDYRDFVSDPEGNGRVLLDGPTIYLSSLASQTAWDVFANNPGVETVSDTGRGREPGIPFSNAGASDVPEEPMPTDEEMAHQKCDYSEFFDFDAAFSEVRLYQP